MSKLKVVVLEDYAEKVLRELSRSGDVQVIDVRGEVYGNLGRLGAVKSAADLGRIEELNKLIVRLDNILTALSFTGGEPFEASSDDLSVLEERILVLEERILPLLDDAEKTLKEHSEVSEEIRVLRVASHALRKAIALGVSSKWLSGARKVYAVAGVIEREDLPELSELLGEKTNGGFLMFPDEEALEGEVAVVLITLGEYKSDVDHVLENARFMRYSIPDVSVSPKDELKRVEEKLSSLAQRKTQLDGEVASLRRKNAPALAYLKEMFGVEKMILETKNLLGKTKTLSILECWTPSKKVQALTKRLEKLTDGAVVVTEEKPREGEAVPVMLDNPSFIRPFEAITRSYGVPGYYEVDPTIFLAVSFPLIFGMMFGDVGHGSVMAAIGVLVLRFKRDNPTLSDFARIFTYCGVSSVFFGFLYGSVFGLEDILHPVWLSPIHHLKEGLITELLGLAIFVGFLQMLLGIFIDSANKAYSFGLRKTVAASAARILLFFGVVSIITKLFGFPVPLFTSIVGVPLKVIVAVGFAVPAVLIIGGEASHALKKASLGGIFSLVGDSLFEVLDSITMFLSNTISYSRIIILALIHAFLSEVVYVLGGLAGRIPYAGFALYYVVVFAGTLVLIIGLEGLVVYVHTLRLHFYEWFTKFYGGGGVPYKPFKVTPRYMLVKKT